MDSGIVVAKPFSRSRLKARAAAVCLDLHHPAEEAVGSRDLAGEEPASAETRKALADTKRQLPVVGMEVIL